MSATPKPYRDIANYLRLRLERMRCCDLLIEEKLYNDKTALFENIATTGKDAAGKIFHHLEYVVANTFRYSLLIGMCSFLEEATKAICQLAVPDYEKQLKKLKIKRKSWLHKHLRLLENTSGFHSNRLQQQEVEFDDLITLRNCVVHSWGKIGNALQPADVLSAVNRLRITAKAQNLFLADISSDGYLVLGEDTVPHAISLAEDIADAILISTLRVSIT